MYTTIAYNKNKVINILKEYVNEHLSTKNQINTSVILLKFNNLHWYFNININDDFNVSIYNIFQKIKVSPYFQTIINYLSDKYKIELKPEIHFRFGYSFYNIDDAVETIIKYPEVDYYVDANYAMSFHPEVGMIDNSIELYNFWQLCKKFKQEYE